MNKSLSILILSIIITFYGCYLPSKYYGIWDLFDIIVKNKSAEKFSYTRMTIRPDKVISPTFMTIDYIRTFDTEFVNQNGVDYIIFQKPYWKTDTFEIRILDSGCDTLLLTNSDYDFYFLRSIIPVGPRKYCPN